MAAIHDNRRTGDPVAHVAALAPAFIDVIHTNLRTKTKDNGTADLAKLLVIGYIAKTKPYLPRNEISILFSHTSHISLVVEDAR